MPTLEWIGKDKVVNHHQDVPFRVLEHRYTYNQNGYTETEMPNGNMIIKGDNLEALKALLPKHEGKIKCIYIDPPYNTGNEGWVYNDNVNDPKIKKWLGEVVGKEGEDLSRHDKWLCMMYPRLKLLQRLLADDGAMVISIGYQELFNLIPICKEIFSTKQIVSVTVQTSGGKPSGGFNYVHEYLVFIVPKDFKPNPLLTSGGNARSPFEGLTLSTFDKTQRPNQVYPIFVDEKTGHITGVGESLQERITSGKYTGGKSEFIYDYSEAPGGTVALWPISSKGNECVWRLIPSRLLSDWEKGYIKVKKNVSKTHPNKYSIQYLPDGVIKKIKNGTLPILGTEDGVPTLAFGENKTVGSEIPTIWNEKAFFTVKGSGQITEIFRPKAFEYPKPVDLIEEIIRSVSLSDENAIILDSFAGSGTTGHAVLKLNAQDNGNRRFILVEMMDYAESITAERVRRVIDGYGNTDGTGGSFGFYELGEPMLYADGNINENISVEKIRDYVWYMETKQPVQTVDLKENPYYLGTISGTAYFFHYEKDCVTALDTAFLKQIRISAERYIIYADQCTLSDDELMRYNIIFKKIPRDIAKL